MRKQTEIKEEKIKALKELFEAKFRIKLPLFYLEFLKERMKEQETKDRGILLFFRKGREGGFEWISYYRKRVVGLCNRTNCKICNLEEREKLKNFKGGELRVQLELRRSRDKTREFYIGHFISFPEEKIKIPVLGIPTKEGELSVLQATNLLKRLRPDLKDEPFVCVRLYKEWAVCLDLRGNPKEDCPLVTINLKDKEMPPIQTHHSFKEAVREAIVSWKRMQAAKERVANRRKEVERAKGRKFSHIARENALYPLQPKPRDWHPLIRRVHDVVVGRTAFRYNPRFGALEVDEFYAPDHPEYEEGGPLRNLLFSIFGFAYHLGGTLDIVFTRDIREDEETGKIIDWDWQKFLPDLPPQLQKEARENRGRVFRPVPQEIVKLAQKYGIVLKEAEKGKISHKEGVELFFKLFEFPAEIEEKINRLVEKGYFTKEALCFVLASGIWNKEEAIWFFLNIPRPEAVILGTDAPENRLFHSESINWGRSVYLVSLLQRKIYVDLSGGMPEEERVGIDCELEPQKDFWVLRANKGFYLPWQIKDLEPVWIEAQEPLLLLSLPQQTSFPEKDKAWLEEKIDFLAKVESKIKKRCLLLSFEFSDLKYGMSVSEEMKEIARKAREKNVYLLFSPYKLDILNDEVEKKMAKARRLKHFKPRKAPLKLWIFELPKEAWQKPALKFSVEDILSAADWIREPIDVRLGRIRFQANCQVIERIAFQEPESRLIAEIDGRESQELIDMLTDRRVTLPFVLPEEWPQFYKKLPKTLKEILKKVEGGIIVVVPPYQKSDFEPREESSEVFPVITVPPTFKFPVDPENIDYSKYKQGYRKEEIKRFHQQIQKALKTGEPLAISYLPHELFPEVIRDYLYYRASFKERRKKVLWWEEVEQVEVERDPPQPIPLRIVYSDGTEGKPFPLFSLSASEKPPETSNFYELKMGTISERHAILDLIVENYLLTNISMKRKGREGAFAQEDYAFRETLHFLTNFVDLLQHKRVEEIIQEIRFGFLWKWLKLYEKEYSGLKLHLFQTGLEPAVVGIYRAIVEFLKERRGELIVVPRLISHREIVKLREKRGEEKKIATEKAYIKAKEWF